MRKIAVIVTLAFVALAPIFFITCSATEPPILTLLPKLDNAAVHPEESGTWTQTFNYTVNCNFSGEASIRLEIYNLSLHDWTTVGDETYIDEGEWQTLTWHNVKICGGKCEGTSSYRFTYNETILLTESGPRIAPPPPTPPAPKMFKNATVKPASGHYNDSFDYSVWVKLNTTTNITLEVYDISSYEWRPMGEEGYSNKGEWQLLTWADVTNVSAEDSVGVASYRFFFVEAGGERHESDVFYGPYLELYPTPTPTVIYRGGGGGGGGVSRRTLLEDVELQRELAEKLSPFITPVKEIRTPQLIYAKVTPERGSWNGYFDYYAEVEHPNRTAMNITLEVYCPGKKENRTIKTREINSSMYNETNIARVEWRDVNVFSKEDVKAEESPKYYIHFNDRCNNDSREFPGPELNSPPVLSNPTVSPEEGTHNAPFVYKVEVKDEDGDDVYVTLHIVDSEGNWKNETHVISGIEAKRGKTERWIYNEFGEDAANKAFEYYFSATDGIDPNATSTRIGPSIKLGFIGELNLAIKHNFYLFLGLLSTIIVMGWLIRWIYKNFFKREIEEEIV